MVPAKVSSFAFHAPFFVRFRRRTELAVESPVRTKRHEPSCLFPAIALEDLFHGRRQVVVSEFAEDTMKEAEGQLMRLQNARCVAWAKAQWNAAPLAMLRIANTCSFVRSPATSAYASYQMG